MSCRLCERVKTLSSSKAAPLVHEFENSILIAGDHQFFPGYSVLILKTHAVEAHDLEPKLQLAFHQELMRAGQAIARAYHPRKLNYASLGNQDSHLHWHLFPRYETDPNRHQHPWFDAAKFSEFSTTSTMAQDVAERLRQHLV